MLTLAGAPHYDVCREGGIKVLIGAVVKKNVWLPHFNWRNPDILTKYIMKISNCVMAHVLLGFLRTQLCSTPDHRPASRETARCCSSGSDSFRPDQQFVANY